MEVEGTKPLCPMEGCEFGGPPWTLGMSTYRVLSDERLLCSFSSVDNPSKTLALLSMSDGALDQVPTPYQAFGSVEVHVDRSNGRPKRIALVGGSTLKPSEIAVCELQEKSWTVLKVSSPNALNQAYLSEPQVIKYPTSNGKRHAYM